MNQQEFFSKFDLLAPIPKSKKTQLYNYFSTAPDWVIDSCLVERITPNTAFIQKNTPVHTIYFIVDGIYKATDDRALGLKFEFAQFTKLYAMGGMEIFMDLDHYHTTLTTVDSCFALTMPKAIYEKWISSSADIMRYESKMMGEYLLEQGRFARECLFLPGAIRIAKILILKYEKYAHDETLQLKLCRQSLANETCFSTKTITRSVKTLQDMGVITKKNTCIFIDQDQYLCLKQLVEDVVSPAMDESVI